MFLFLILSFTFIPNSYSKNEKRVFRLKRLSKHFEKKGLDFLSFYTSLLAVKESNKISKEFNQKTEEYFEKYGFIMFSVLSANDIEILPKNVKNYIKGRYFFFKEDYDLAIKYLSKISSENPRAAQANMFIATSHYLLSHNRQAIAYAKRCQEIAGEFAEKFPESSWRNKEYQYVKESCEILIPRIYYALGQLSKALELYKGISSKSYHQPRTLVELSWLYYRQKKFNRSYGKLVPFESPFMRDYVYPEAEYIKGLIFLKYCHVDNFNRLLTSFEKNIMPQKNKIKNLLNNFRALSKVKNDILLNEQEFKSPWGGYLLTRVSTKIMKTKYLKLARNYKYLLAHSNSMSLPVYKLLKNVIGRLKGEFDKYFVSQIRNELRYLLKQINFYSKSLLDQKLNVLTLMKRKLYQKDLKENKEESYVQVSDMRKKNEYLWDFKQEFWVDELIYYVTSFRSQCDFK